MPFFEGLRTSITRSIERRQEKRLKKQQAEDGLVRELTRQQKEKFNAEIEAGEVERATASREPSPILWGHSYDRDRDGYPKWMSWGHQYCDREGNVVHFADLDAETKMAWNNYWKGEGEKPARPRKD